MTTLTVPPQHAINAARWISRLAYLIAAIGVATSYSTQVELLARHDVGTASWAIPATIDILAVCAAMALQLPGLDQVSRRVAGWILSVATLVSIIANVMAGANPVAKAAHAWPVVAYLLGEWLANRVRAYAATLIAGQAARAEAATVSTSVPETVAELESAALPQAPVSPAPAGRPRIPTDVLPDGKVVHSETRKPVSPRTATRRRTQPATGTGTSS